MTMSPAPLPARTILERSLAISAGSAVAVGLGGCSRGVLDPAGPVGGAERVILFDALAVMLCIVVPTIAATLLFAWWFRAGNARAKRLPHWAFSGKVEVVTWSVPLLTILFLGGIAWVGSHDLDPAKALVPSTDTGDARPLDVQVVALDWKWLFIYPSRGVACVNKLVIPAHVPVHFSLTSASVMNTFFVPRLGSMIYVMNGMAGQLNLQADREGTFAGLSGHFSGDGFSDMRFDTVALAREGFDAWVAGAEGKGPFLDRGAYENLSKQSGNVPPMTYGGVAPDIFTDVVTQQIPPGPGPEAQAAPRTDDAPKLDPKAGG